MGLLFQFPVERNELDDRIKIHDKEVTLKTYGLPMIFWGYMAAILVFVFFMFLAIQNPINTLIKTKDPLNVFLGYLVLGTLTVIPLTLFTFFFYEKNISKKGNILTIRHKVFWVTFYKKTYLLNPLEGLVLDHFLDSPNMARIQNKEQMKGFQNRGYYELQIVCSDGTRRLLDRHTRPTELRKMKELLEEF